MMLAFTSRRQSRRVKLVSDENVVKRPACPLQVRISLKVAQELLLTVRSDRPLCRYERTMCCRPREDHYIHLLGLCTFWGRGETRDLVQKRSSAHRLNRGSAKAFDNTGERILEPFANQVFSFVFQTGVFVDSLAEPGEDLRRRLFSKPWPKRVADDLLKLRVLARLRHSEALIRYTLLRGPAEPLLGHSSGKLAGGSAEEPIDFAS